MKRIVLVSALILLVTVGGSVVVRLANSAPAQGSRPARYLWVGEDFANAHGNRLSIGNVIVLSDRLIIQYRAFGVSPDQAYVATSGSTITSGAAQPPTAVTGTADGVPLVPIEGNVGSDPQSGVVSGDFSWRWAGGTPRHLHLVVTRILGDANANWTADFDLPSAVTPS